jgi:hypothetical protein
MNIIEDYQFDCVQYHDHIEKRLLPEMKIDQRLGKKRKIIKTVLGFPWNNPHVVIENNDMCIVPYDYSKQESDGMVPFIGRYLEASTSESGQSKVRIFKAMAKDGKAAHPVSKKLHNKMWEEDVEAKEMAVPSAHLTIFGFELTECGNVPRAVLRAVAADGVYRYELTDAQQKKDEQRKEERQKKLDLLIDPSLQHLLVN